MLKVELYQMGYFVFGRVVEQDESLRCGQTSWDTLVVAKSDTFSILSHDYPQLRENSLFIRGSVEDDDNVYFSYSYDTALDATKACEEIKKLVDEVNDTGPTQCWVERCFWLC